MPTLTREALYALVWTDAVRTVAARFGVSDVALRKACISANVPMPERGYWAKLQVGKSVIKVTLPPRDPGMAETVSIRKDPYTWSHDPEAELAEPLPALPVFEEPIEAVRARVAPQVGKVSALRNLDSVCAGIRKLLDEDDRRRAKQGAQTWSSDWYAPRFDSPFERRRLRVLNSLAFAFAKSGAKLEIRGKEARELTVVVGSQRVAFALDHPAAKPTIHGEWKTRAGQVDDLKLKMKSKFPEAGVTGIWVDDDGKIEDRLTDIVVCFLVAGEVQYRAAQVSHHAWLIERRARNVAELAERRAEAERQLRQKQQREIQARRAQLLTQASDWRTAQDIRAFVGDVLAEAARSPHDDRISAWKTWALAEADAIDPVKQGLEPWRGGEDATDCEFGCGDVCEHACECGLERACECTCER